MVYTGVAVFTGAATVVGLGVLLGLLFGMLFGIFFDYWSVVFEDEVTL